MILVRNLRLDIGQSSDRLKVKAARELKLPTWAIKDVKITKALARRARRKTIYTGCIPSPFRSIMRKSCWQNAKSKNVAAYEAPEYTVPQASAENSSVVAGFGPGGMFAALVLSMAGLKPVVNSSAAPMPKRAEKGRSLPSRR